LRTGAWNPRHAQAAPRAIDSDGERGPAAAPGRRIAGYQGGLRAARARIGRMGKDEDRWLGRRAAREVGELKTFVATVIRRRRAQRLGVAPGRYGRSLDSSAI